MANVHAKWKRRISILLSLSVIMSLTACRKSKKEKKDLYSAGRVIEATDPYFVADVDKVMIPSLPKKKLQTQSVTNCIYTGEYAIVSYNQSYELPDDLQKMVDSASITGEEFDIEEYFVESTALFNKEGVLIREFDRPNSNLLGVALDKDGNIHILFETFLIDEIEVDPYASYEEQLEQIEHASDILLLIDIYDHDGNLLDTIKLDEDLSLEYSWQASLEILDNGLYSYSSAGTAYLVNSDGKLERMISDGDRSILGNIVQKNGKNYIASEKRDQDEGRSLLLKDVDLETGVLGKGTDITSLLSYGTTFVTKDGLFASSYSGFFRYDIEKNTIDEVFNWNDTDVDRSLMKNIQCTPLNENEILAVGHRSFEIDFPYLIHLTRAETNPHAGKKMLVIAGENISDCSELVSFAGLYSSDPKNSSRVIIVDYTAGMSEKESHTAIEQSIYLDTLSGSGPDILVNMFDSIAFRSDAIMEDMNQYIDGERGISRSDYFDNILRACETDGALYHLPARFSLEGLCVNSAYIPNTDGWTYDEFFTASENVPQEVSFLEGYLYNDLLKIILSTSLTQFVDYKNRTVDFNNDTMKEILRTVKQYGMKELPSDEGWYHMDNVEIPGEGWVSGDGDHTLEKIQEGMLAAWTVTYDSIYTSSYYNFNCPENVSFLGYPSMEKIGMAVKPKVSMGIVSSSDSKGVAWDFIKAFMEYDVPRSLYPFGMPIRISAFDKESADIMKERNEYREDFKSTPGMAKMLGACPVLQEDIDLTRILVTHASISTSGDPAIFDIICEEAAGYFAGDRSVEDVLANIQNRASTVVKEL